MAYITFQPSDYFNTLLYTGNGATSTAGTLARTISGVGFQPDFTWLKERTSVSGGYTTHGLHDVVRGASKWIGSNSTSGQSDVTTDFGNGGLGSFTSDGFGIYSGTGGGTNNYNINTGNYVAWNWKANGSGVSNTDGSTSSTVSANTTAGISIIQYTGNSTSGATIGHGLGAVPKVFFCKKTNSSGDSWRMYTEMTGNESQLALDQTSAADSGNTAMWNSTTPTSSVITLGNHTGVNGNTDTFIGYAFAEKKGFSKFGSYTGNGNADGTFIYTGFKPAWVMVKNTSNTQSWYILDNKRNTYNPLDKYMSADTDAADQTATFWDYLSNGIKIRGTISGFNTSGDNYIYMAFAEEPLISSNGIPATAR